MRKTNPTGARNLRRRIGLLPTLYNRFGALQKEPVFSQTTHTITN